MFLSSGPRETAKPRVGWTSERKKNAEVIAEHRRFQSVGGGVDQALLLCGIWNKLCVPVTTLSSIV